MAKDLLAVFGKPKGPVEAEESPESESPPDGIPVDFRDHCEAAFDAVKSGDSETFCKELWLAVKAYEETPHDEGGEESDEDEEY